MKKLQIDGESLAIEDIVAVSREDIEMAHLEEAIEKVRERRKTPEQFVKDKKMIYGIMTGVRI
jgi:histidine ammonia-lyase